MAVKIGLVGTGTIVMACVGHTSTQLRQRVQSAMVRGPNSG